MAPQNSLYERQNALDVAVASVKNGDMSVRRASRVYSVPRETIRRHVVGISQCVRRGPPTHFTKEIEKELKDAIMELGKMGHGVGVDEVQILAEEMTAKKEELEPFKNGLPTRGWVQRFRKRNNLSLRTPENTSAARYNNETLEVKNEFYDRLQEVYQKLIPLGLNGLTIYNVDETGLCVVTKSGKVVMQKGVSQVRARTGGERGENITVVTAANAAGTVILPPTIIFRGKTLNEDLMFGAMDGTVFATAPKSFITCELFSEWFDRFVVCIPPTRPVLLLMDGHVSHVSLSVIKKAMANDIHILIFPPHTTHLYQPLDVSVFGPLKTSFAKEAKKLMRKNKLKHLNRYHFCQILTPAWTTAVVQKNIVSGFECTGIWPLDRSRVILPIEKELPPNMSEGQSTSENSTDADSTISPVVAVIREFLKPVENTPTARSKKITKTRMITSFEFAKEMEEKENAKMLKEREELQKKKRKADAKKCNPKKSGKQAEKGESECSSIDDPSEEEFSSSKENDAPAENRKKEVSRKCKPKKQNTPATSSSESDEESSDSSTTASEDNTPCGTCGEVFQRDFHGETWIQCVECNEWFHNKCQNMGEKSYDPNFRCDECSPIANLIAPANKKTKKVQK